MLLSRQPIHGVRSNSGERRPVRRCFADGRKKSAHAFLEYHNARLTQQAFLPTVAPLGHAISKQSINPK